MTKTDFIEEMGFLAQKVNNSLKHHILPSICVAQACLESGYGKASKMMKYNAPFGIKATASWKGAFYNSITGEYYAGGYVKENAAFRAYSSLEEAVEDYYKLLTSSSYYEHMVDNYNVKSAVEGLYAYATNPNYAADVLTIITKYGLTRFDTLSTGAEASKTENIIVNTKVSVLPDEMDGMRKYIYDKNGVRNRLWYPEYEVMQVDGSNLLIGVNGVATCWINKSKAKEV